jgi:hypothetical protein
MSFINLRSSEWVRQIAQAKEQEWDRLRQRSELFGVDQRRRPPLLSPFRATARFFRRYVGRVDRIGPNA